MAVLISEHPVQNSIAIQFHNSTFSVPYFFLKITVLFCFVGSFLSNLFVYLVAFGNILRKEERATSMITVIVSLSGSGLET